MEIGYTKDTNMVSSALQRDRLAAEGVAAVLTEDDPKAFSVRDSLVARLQPGDLVTVTSLLVLGKGLLEILRVINNISMRGADLVSLDDQIDSRKDKAFFPLTFKFLTVGVEHKSRAGALAYKNAREAGVRTGRKKVLSAADTQRMIALMNEGLKPEALATLFNVSISTVFNIKRRAKKSEQ